MIQKVFDLKVSDLNWYNDFGSVEQKFRRFLLKRSAPQANIFHYFGPVAQNQYSNRTNFYKRRRRSQVENFCEGTPPPSRVCKIAGTAQKVPKSSFSV